jgi:hypothetical protein
MLSLIFPAIRQHTYAYAAHRTYAYAAYSYERPMLSLIFPANGAATGRMTVTCLGSNFGLVDMTIAFRIGGTSCEVRR